MKLLLHLFVITLSFQVYGQSLFNSILSRNESTFLKDNKVSIAVSKKFHNIRSELILVDRKGNYKKYKKNEDNEKDFTTVKIYTYQKIKRRKLKVGYIDPQISKNNDIFLSFRTYKIDEIPFADIVISLYDLKKKQILNLTEKGVIYIKNINLAKFLFPNLNLRKQKNSCLKDIQYFLSEFNRTRKILSTKKDVYLNSRFRLKKIEISNNCREPGSFEIGVFATNNKKLNKVLSGAVHLPYEYMAKIVKTWSGKFPHEMGVADLRVPITVFNKDGELEKYFYKTKSILNSKKKLTNCSISNVDDEVFFKNETIQSSGYLGERSFKYISDKIPFDDLPKEVQKKSAYKQPKRNSYLFLKINRSINNAPKSFLQRSKIGYNLPKYFFTLVNGKWHKHSVEETKLNVAKNGFEFWKITLDMKEKVYVPHRFKTYSEMFGAFNKKEKKLVGGYWSSKDINILPSSFEVDGRYGAELSIDHFNADRLWAIDLSFIKRIDYHESYVHLTKSSKEKVVSFNLKCTKECKGKIHNIAIRNINLKPGQRKEVLLGIGVEPLEVEYNHKSKVNDLVYALTYNKDGQITDHNPEIGKIVVTRGKYLNDKSNKNTYTIDVITDDRIHPLARYQVEL